VVHIGEMKEVERRQEDAEGIYLVKEFVPVIYVDLALRVIPPMEGEIQIEAIRNLVYDLRDRVGFRFARITYDHPMSKDSQQTLKHRFGEEVVGYLSVDRHVDQYLLLKELIYEGRLHCYPYPPLLQELLQLQYNPKTGKVDHPPNQDKDIADGLAGACWNAIEGVEGLMPSETQRGVFEETIPLKDKLDAEAMDWLYNRKPKEKKPDVIDMEKLEHELMDGLEDEIKKKREDEEK
ncbi:unnamed protein product, partial [marine sediment metagenome]